MDSMIACEDGSSQWITSANARKHAHDLRAQCQAILVGVGTAVKDNPQLTVRYADVGPHQVMSLVSFTAFNVQKGLLSTTTTNNTGQ